MQENEKIIGQELPLGILRNCLIHLGKGKGSIVCLTGESGTGKTFVLSRFNEEIFNEKDIDSIFVQCQPPIGNFKISNLQPLLPFQRIIEKLEENKNTSAGKRLAIDVGLTTLSTVPIGGEIFYWVKEVRRALENYKKERKKETESTISVGAEFYYNTLMKYVEKKRLVLIIDDFHWSDSQSIELLNFFAGRIDKLPIMFIISYNKTILESAPSPLNAFFERYKDSENVFFPALESFSLPDIRSTAKIYFANYKPNNEFEEWLFQKSYGVPGVVIEYLKYFQKNSPFTPTGELAENFGLDGNVPGNLHSAFSDTFDKLSEEERNILAVCSAEGREFTALVISNLMNTDVLSAIKKLRNLQTKTRIIKSIGPKVRYGQTTTVYEFTQPFYQTFFENSLEYEEQVALHGQIAALLKQKYEEAENEAIKHQIAPYVAAHSSAAGDVDTAKNMLLVTAHAAEEYGSSEIVQEAYESYKKLKKRIGKTEEEQPEVEDIAFQELFQKSKFSGFFGDSANSQDSIVTDNNSFIDFNALRSIVVDDFLKGNYSASADKSITYFNARENELKLSEQSQLLSIAVRAYIEQKDFSSADLYSQKALNLPGLSKDSISESFVYNAIALLYYNENKIEDSLNFLRKAAQKAISLPPEIRLLTISNIALIQQKLEPEKSKKYFSAMKKLLKYLNYEELSEEIFN